MYNVKLFNSNSTSAEVKSVLTKRINFNEYIIGILKEGISELQINDIRYYCVKDDLILLLPNSTLQMESVSSDYRALFILVENSAHVPILQFKNTIQYRHIYNNPVIQLNKSDIEIFKTYYHLINSVIESKSHIYSQQVISTLINSMRFQMSSYFLKVYFTKRDNLESPHFFLLQNFFQNLSNHHRKQRQVLFYAAESAMDRRYFSKIIKELTGITPKQWINIEVLQTAKTLLLNKELSIKEIAEQLSFAHSSAFSSFFITLTSITPTQFRNTLS